MSFPQDRFEQAVDRILERDPRYAAQAYHFLKDALDFAIDQIKGRESKVRHVSGQELCEGFRDLALKNYGPMAATLLGEWGIDKSADIGEMVFNLIDARIFSSQKSDCRSDYVNRFSFEEAFVKPFLPKSRSNDAA